MYYKYCNSNSCRGTHILQDADKGKREGEREKYTPHRHIAKMHMQEEALNLSINRHFRFVLPLFAVLLLFKTKLIIYLIDTPNW